MKNNLLLSIPEAHRRTPIYVAQLERDIEGLQDYINGTSIRHPACNGRASRRIKDLQQAVNFFIEIYPWLTREVIDAGREHTADSGAPILGLI